MSSLLLNNVRVFGQDGVSSCLLEGDRIKKFNSADKADKVIDCQNNLLLPSLIDYQSFFNNDIERLEAAAAASGFCASWTMLPDNRKNKTIILSSNSLPSPFIVPPITTIDAGEERLADLRLAHKAGSRFFSNGDSALADNELMKQAMTTIADLGGVLLHQPQDPALARGGVMNEGRVSAELGLKGIPAEAETIMLARDIELVRMTGCSYIAQQLSTARAVAMVGAAKAAGLPIACSVSINHLLLNEDAIGDFRTFCKLTPPLRTEADRLALVAAVKDGTIDYIVSAHNPQSQEAKRVPFEYAEAGSIGLETFLAAIFLLHKKEAPKETIELDVLLKKITTAPHKLEEGGTANIVCFDDKSPWQLDVATTPLPSKTQNSALDGLEFTGKIVMAILNGEVKFNARAN